MFKKAFLFVVFSAGIITMTGCYYDKAELLYPGGNDCQLSVRFAANVNPLVQSKCANSPDCHSSGSSNSGGPLTNYTQIKNLSEAIRSQVISGLMPKNGSLTQSERQIIVCWTDAGSPNN